MTEKWYFISPLILQQLIWVPTRIILKFFGHFKIDGLDNLKKIKSNVIFACNHASELDPILIPAALPFFSRFSPMFYVSREKRFYSGAGWRRYFYGGLFFKFWGSYPVYVGLRNYEKALINHISIVRHGGNLCIFPEGRTTPNGVIQSAKGGVVYLAHTTRIPIIPVKIIGTFNLTFSDFVFRRKHLSVIFGKPIYEPTYPETVVPIEEFKKHANNITDILKNML